MADITIREFAVKVLEDSKIAMTDQEIWEYGAAKGWDKDLKSQKGKTPWQSIYAILSNYQNGIPHPDDSITIVDTKPRRKFIMSVYENSNVRIDDANSTIIAPTVYPDELPDESSEYREGKKKTVAINIHERNPTARKLCIKHYGAKCFICDFDFGKIYGTECNGMIHVHHLKMISDTDDEYVVNPIQDLRPVFPNCHMVLHSKNSGVYSVEEVKLMLQKSKFS